MSNIEAHASSLLAGDCSNRIARSQSLDDVIAVAEAAYRAGTAVPSELAQPCSVAVQKVANDAP